MDFANCVQNLHNLLDSANLLSTPEEFFDKLHTSLDELWRLPHNYPQNRMADLMDIIC